MPTTVPYVDVNTFKAEYTIRNTVEDDRIERCLAAASAAINKACDRTFYAVSATGADEERYYTPATPRTVWIDDLLELHEFATDLSGTGTFTTIWEEPRDVVLLPLNAAAKGRPFERVRVTQLARYLLPGRERSVRVTGVFGWLAVPDEVISATLLLARRLFLRKDAPWGVATFGTEVALRLLRSDPDVSVLLDDLTRDTIVYG